MTEFVAGQRIGYVRVSTLEQNDQRQLEGQVLDQVFTDHASGKNTQRPKLEELIRFARAGTPSWCIPWTAWPGTWMTCGRWCRS